MALGRYPKNLSRLCQRVNFYPIFACWKWKPSFLRFTAYAVTLSGLAGGEGLPLPASKGLAFPFLLALEGCPHRSSKLRSGTMASIKMWGKSTKMAAPAAGDDVKR